MSFNTTERAAGAATTTTGGSFQIAPEWKKVKKKFEKTKRYDVFAAKILRGRYRDVAVGRDCGGKNTPWPLRRRCAARARIAAAAAAAAAGRPRMTHVVVRLRRRTHRY